MHRALGGVVDRQARARAERGGRADIDEDAAAVRPHVGRESLGGEEDRFDVDREDAVELLFRHLHDRLVAMGRAGVVDDDVDPPERGDRLARRPLDIGPARDVGVDRDRARTEPPGGRFGDVALHVEAGDSRALAHKGFGDAETEPLPRAGHQRGLAFQSHALNPRRAR